LTWLYLKNKQLLRKGLRILHVAPEKSLQDRFKALEGVDYIAGDKNEPGYSYPPGTIELDVTSIPFPDARFDLIICSHVLEHVPDDRKAMSEMHRVLAPGGSAILMVPINMRNAETAEDPAVTDPKERERLYGQFDHVRLYGRDYAQRLSDAGFTVAVEVPSEKMSGMDVFRFGLLPGEVLHAVTK
jgi:SAM-dependent methyltransferase